MKKALLSSLALVTALSAFAQNPSSLDFKKAITATEAQQAMDALESSMKLSQCKTGVYNMRGGKEGGVPASHAYQYQYNLDTDNYCQYFVVSHKDFPYANNTHTSTYNISSFNGSGHGGYNLVKQIFPNLLVSTEVNNLPEIKAIYLLYFDLMAQENADLSGPFTYKEDLNNSEDPRTYNSVKDIYYAIKADIDNCVACWEYYDANRDAEYKEVVESYLNIMESDGNANWNYSMYIDGVDHRFVTFMHLANSLQLRLAMHMTKIEPATAKAWAEEAVKRGVIASVQEQQGVFPTTIGFIHPLVEIGCTWNDTRISASFESLLMSLEHPYSKYFFQPNANAIEDLTTHKVTEADSRIIGIRSGEYVGEGQSAGSNPFINYSSFEKDVIEKAPLYFISYAETCFLQAEGAIRGWNMGGTAAEFYEKGIRNGYMEDPYYLENGWLTAAHNYTEYVDDYLKVEKAQAYTQVDPQGLGEPWPSVTKIGVKWNEADDLETKLEKIITQKYIALFPDSHEAWTELRRTGYPKLFPVLNANDGDGSIKQGDMIRRIPYRIEDPVQKGYWEATGLPLLGGPDVQATRLWWDVDAPNFGEQAGVHTTTITTGAGKTFMLDGRISKGATRGITIQNGKKIVR